MTTNEGPFGERAVGASVRERNRFVALRGGPLLWSVLVSVKAGATHAREVRYFIRYRSARQFANFRWGREGDASEHHE